MNNDLKEKIYVSKKFVNEKITLTKKELAILIAISSTIALGSTHQDYYITTFNSVDMLIMFLGLKKDKNKRAYNLIQDNLISLEEKGVIKKIDYADNQDFFRVMIFKSKINLDGKVSESFFRLDFDSVRSIVLSDSFSKTSALLSCYAMINAFIWDSDQTKLELIAGKFPRIKMIENYLFSSSMKYLGFYYSSSMNSTRKHVDELLKANFIAGANTADGLQQLIYLTTKENEELLKEYLQYSTKTTGIKYKMLNKRKWVG